MSDTQPLLVIEALDNGSLYDILHNETILIDGDLAMHILQDVVHGMRFLVGCERVHGDLKSSNVLIDQYFRAKLTNFAVTDRQRAGINFGSPYWMAPELVTRRGTPCQKTDVYAFSITMFELFSREDPYAGQAPKDVLYRLSRSSGHHATDHRPGIPENCVPFCAELMKDCWETDPALRPNFDEITERIAKLELSGVNMGRNAMNRLSERSRQAHNVLFDVFPKHIAEALVAGRKVEPERKESTTIFFSDIVGFTTISSTMDPELVSDMLNRSVPSLCVCLCMRVLACASA